MLKPSLQLKLGQTLTMTPQLQQAIRLLQLPALELQAHIRELLESNVMLEPVEESEAGSTGIFEAPEITPTAAPAEAVPERQTENTVEVVDEGWGEQSVGSSETPWNSDDDDVREPDGPLLADESAVAIAIAAERRLAAAKEQAHDSPRTPRGATSPGATSAQRATADESLRPEGNGIGQSSDG